MTSYASRSVFFLDLLPPRGSQRRRNEALSRERNMDETRLVIYLSHFIFSLRLCFPVALSLIRACVCVPPSPRLVNICFPALRCNRHIPLLSILFDSHISYSSTHPYYFFATISHIFLLSRNYPHFPFSFMELAVLNPFFTESTFLSSLLDRL